MPNPKDATSPVPPAPHAQVRSLCQGRTLNSYRIALAHRRSNPPTDATGGVSPLVPATRRSTLPDRSRDRRHPPAQERAALPRAALWRWRMGGGVAPEALGFADTQLPSLNDDRVGRCLDRLFRSDVTSLVLALATHVVREFQVDLDELHNDSTTVTFHGVYADATEEEKRGQATRMAITWGYNKDHRPDLKQLLYILTVSGDGAVPLYFQVASGNVVDDQTHCATWDLLCRLTGRRDFLYVADCKLASTENMAYIHQRQGRFLTVLPRTRAEDRVFRNLLSQGQIQWRHIHDKRNDQGEIVDRYSVSVPATLSAEGYRLVWYHSTSKAEHDARTRHQQVERALIELAELRQKLSSPRSCYHQAAKVAEAVQSILKARGVEGWIVTEIKERTEEKYRQDRRGRPNAETRYVKQTSTRFELEYHIDSVQLAAETCCDGVFPLITNDGLLSELELLLAYKGQPSLENASRT